LAVIADDVNGNGSDVKKETPNFIEDYQFEIDPRQKIVMTKELDIY
jgi:hypothetical protein